MTHDIRDASRRKMNFLQTLKAVLWGMFGVRRGAGYEEDAGKLNPVHLIIAGLLAGAIFVTLLVLIVRWAVASLS
ncbi:hypothetical protein CAL18_19150 [Bordetella genomosp. 7]|jgi:hypothetical protein|uniref:DUF2970 domain-containing protein n=1 Tax=Bordetella genomosp. 7 TaxID=1416805 RepID=A0A261QVR2_9BORD|nr:MULTISPECIES: DUF2970 domain-containing protein [Bordetella]OZI16071.1 hypothetical protein CAL18_19150 [Bordetella genomosp. 7]OZI16826.1 hypothetical protein CAL19_19405 [Bordetella genomosp. 7]